MPRKASDLVTYLVRSVWQGDSGVRTGRPQAADGMRLVKNRAEQAVIARIRDSRAAGRTLREIAAQLTADGVPTKKLRGAWTHQVIGKIVGRFSGRVCVS